MSQRLKIERYIKALVLFLAVLGFELKASHLLGSHFTP
jgi:hypothetical protein